MFNQFRYFDFAYNILLFMYSDVLPCLLYNDPAPVRSIGTTV